MPPRIFNTFTPRASNRINYSIEKARTQYLFMRNFEAASDTPVR